MRRATQQRLHFVDEASPTAQLAGARIDATDPLAVLDLGRANGRSRPNGPTGATAVVDGAGGPSGTIAVRSPLQGTVVQIDVGVGDAVGAGQQLLVMEAMKMEHVVSAPESGYVRLVGVTSGDTVFEGHPLVYVEPSDVGDLVTDVAEEVDLDAIRADLAQIVDRHAVVLDAARPDAVARRRKTNQRTARENIDDLCDAGTFVEHGSLVLTPGTGLPMDEVIRKFPTDGMVCGVGSVNAEQFGADRSRAAVLAYDYTVLAGTQGAINHPKTDRMLELARAWKLPVVFFTEGGGGRAGTGGNRTGEVGKDSSSGNLLSRPLVTPSMARLNGVVPTVGSTPGAASRATPRCSARATSSSLPRTRTSAWAARR